MIGALLLAMPTHAAPWEPKSRPARQLLEQGRAAFKSGDYAGAAALFLQSAEAEGSHNARWNAGQAFAAAGDWKRGLDLFDALANDKTLPRDRRPDVERRQRVAGVFVAAAYAAEAARWDDASAALKKLIADPALGDRDRANATSALEAVAARRTKAEADRAQAETDRARVEAEARVRQVDAKPEASTTSDRQPPPTIEARPSRLSDPVALTLLGVGLVSVGVGAGFWWHAGQLDDQADEESDQAKIANLRDRADSQRTGGQIALAIGGAVLVAGAIKLAIPPDASRPALATVQPVRGGAVVVLGGTFW